MILNAGDKVPADGVMVSGSDVTVNESSLTGEPEDCRKDGPSNPTADHFLLSGTSLSSGFVVFVAFTQSLALPPSLLSIYITSAYASTSTLSYYSFPPSLLSSSISLYFSSSSSLSSLFPLTPSLSISLFPLLLTHVIFSLLLSPLYISLLSYYPLSLPLPLSVSLTLTHNPLPSSLTFITTLPSHMRRYAHMLVTAVGNESRWGKTKAKLATESPRKRMMSDVTLPHR